MIPELADFCQWWPMGGRPCYAPAGLVLVWPSGQTLGFTCRAHREAWAGQVRGGYLVRERPAWEAGGAGYRGLAPGG
jgi:hypothetical protein